jgi:hypothetical protein
MRIFKFWEWAKKRWQRPAKPQAKPPAPGSGADAKLRRWIGSLDPLLAFIMLFAGLWGLSHNIYVALTVGGGINYCVSIIEALRRNR